MFRISSWGSFSRSDAPEQRPRPEISAYFESVRPMTVSELTLLPDPDSPTIPSVSPGWTVNETPSTALTMPSSVLKWTRRSLTSRQRVGHR